MSNTNVKINDVQSQITITDATVNYIQGEVESKIEYRDIIGIDQPPDEGKDTETIKRRLFYIHHTQKGNKLEKKTLHIKTTKTEMLHLWSELKDKIDKVEGRPKSVVVFLNPLGGSANSLSFFRKDVEPIFKMAEIKNELIVSEKADHFKELSQSFDFTPYDALVIVGGDGTMNEIINGLLQRKQRDCGVDVNDKTAVLKTIDIPIAIIPAGTGNGMVSTSHGCVDVITSVLHIIKGRLKPQLVYGNFCNNKLVAYSVMCTGYGMFCDLMHLVDQHRWMRKMRYVFMPIWFFLRSAIRTFDAEVTLEYVKNDKEDILETVEMESNRKNDKEDIPETIEMESNRKNDKEDILETLEMESNRKNDKEDIPETVETESYRKNDKEDILETLEMESNRKNDKEDILETVETESNRKNDKEDILETVETESNRKNDKEDIPETLETEPSCKAVTEKMTITAMFTIPNGPIIPKSFDDSSGEGFPVLLYKPSSRLAMGKQLFALTGDVTEEDIERSGFVSLHCVKSVKVKILNSETDKDLMVNLDGEIYNLTHPEIYTRMNKDSYRMFSSFEPDRRKETSQ